MDKGTHGYIKCKKNKQLRDTISIALVGIIIFVIGYLLNDNSKNNVFTILAILLALPGAKMLVGYIVVAPYRSMNDKEYEQVCKVISPSIAMISDLVITSPDKVMNLDVVVVDDYQVIALLGKQGQDISYIQTYLMRTIKNQGYSFEVKVLTDFSEFLLRVKTLVTSKEQVPAKEEQDGEDTNSSDRDEIINLLKTLNV